MTNCDQKKAKYELRNRLKPIHKDHQPSELTQSKIINRLKSHPRVQGVTHIGAYMAHRGEINLNAFFDWAQEKGKQIYIPHWHQTDYFWTAYSTHALIQPGRHGILEPTRFPELTPEQAAQKIEVWLVPGLAFDQEGVRLGMGEGNYDRALGHAQGYKIGIVDPQFLLEKIPADSWDVRMDEVLRI